MTSPQKENGFTPIANEILEALGKTNLSSYQSRLLFIIWRKTYGFGKKQDWLSNSQLVVLTGLRKQHVSRAKKELIERKLVTNRGNKIQFNKHYSQWGELPKSVTKEKVTNRGSKVTDLGAKVTNTGEHKRNYTKETIQKKEAINKELIFKRYEHLEEKDYQDYLIEIKAWCETKGIKEITTNRVINWIKKDPPTKKPEKPKMWDGKPAWED